MRYSTFNYIRSFRKQHALSTNELAFLIGQRSKSAVSQFEAGDRHPSLVAAFALQVIFGQGSHELMPGLFEHVEETVMRRVAELIQRLEGRADRASQTKLDLLHGIPGRREDNDIDL